MLLKRPQRKNHGNPIIEHLRAYNDLFQEESDQYILQLHSIGLPYKCHMPNNAINSTKLIEISLIEFKTIISLELLDFPTSLVLK